MFDIQQLIDLNYATDTRKSRRKGTNSTQELLSLNSGKKFDIVLMNPPYGTRIKNEPLHFKFVQKCLEISNIQVTLMPFKLINATSERDKIWKEKFSQNLISVQEEDSKQFKDTGMPNVGIWHWNNNYDDNITITYLNNDEINVKSLLDISNINETEKNIFKYLYNTDIILFNLKVRAQKNTPKNICDEERIKLCEKFSKKSIYNNKWFLSANVSNWSKDAHFTSKKTGKIFNNFKDICNDWISNDLTSLKYIVLNDKKSCENLYNAMQNPLLRLPLYRTQDDQNMNNKCFQYIPNIDWSDPRTTTDEGLLELCGCPKDKCKEYAEYCKEVIDKVDKK